MKRRWLSVLLILAFLTSVPIPAVFALKSAAMQNALLSGEEEWAGLTNLALNKSGSGYPEAFAAYTCPGDHLAHLVDGIVSGKEGAPHDEGPRNRWTNYNQTGTAYIGSVFETEQDVSGVELYAFNDNGGVPTPKSVSAEYWDGAGWKPAENQTVSSAPYGTDGKLVLFQLKFNQISTARLRLRLEPQSNKSVGASEMKIFGKEKILYGFLLNVPVSVSGDQDASVTVNLQEAAEAARTLYLKAADSAGKTVQTRYTIPAGETSVSFAADLSALAAGEIKLTASLHEDFSEQKEYLLQKSIADSVIKGIYEEVKTPYEYGTILSYSGAGSGTFDSDLIDNPNVFTIPGDSEWVYMTYVGHDGTGYRTGLARSKDMLTWEKVGKILDNGEAGAWDEYNAAGYIVRDHIWGNVPFAHRTKDGKYAMTYLASDTPGYEAGIKRAGVAFSDRFFNADGSVAQWARNPDPVLDAHDGTYPYEKGTIWKLQAIWAPEQKRYVGFYNAASRPEVMCQAYSDDLIHWVREGKNPVVKQDVSPAGDAWGASHNSDADVVKVGDYWVMFYFTSSPGGIIDSFAVSTDLVNWQKSYLPLTKRNSTYSSTYAHKPCVVKKNGVVYHYYCAVGTSGRLIAADTSVDLTILNQAQGIAPESCSPAQYERLQQKISALQNELTRENGSLGEVQKAAAELRDTVAHPLADEPGLTAQPQSRTVAEGEPAVFSVAASAGAGSVLTYQWQVGRNGRWKDIPGATAAAYLKDSPLLSDSGLDYRCVVTNAPDGLTPVSATSESASLTVTKGFPRDALRALIAACGKLNPGEFESGSWKTLQEALKEARETAGDEIAAPDEIRASFSRLSASVDGLAARVDKTLLTETIRRARAAKTEGCTEDSVRMFRAALTRAEEILKRPDATSAEVNDAIADLVSSLAGLERGNAGSDSRPGEDPGSSGPPDGQNFSSGRTDSSAVSSSGPPDSALSFSGSAVEQTASSPRTGGGSASAPAFLLAFCSAFGIFLTLFAREKHRRKSP